MGLDYSAYQQERRTHWDMVGRRLDHWTGWGGYYHRRLAEVFRHVVSPGLRVLELGCGQGDLLASLDPSFGVGIDFSAQMIRRAAARHPELHFIQADVHESVVYGRFDVIILSDLLNDLWDAQLVLERIRPLCSPRTRVILNYYSRLWELPMAAAQHGGLAKPNLAQNWFATEDVQNLLYLTGFETIRHWEEVAMPLPLPLLATVANRVLVKLWPFYYFALTNVLIARPAPHLRELNHEPHVSVIIPARNEEGNILAIFERVPEMGGGTELVFVEGHSTDHTYAAIERTMSEHPERACLLLRQVGMGKGDAVRLGFARASGDILMILDADLTVPPEDLPRFFEALCSGKGEFVNGVRLVYPMENQAMRFLNLLGNKLFGLAFSWLLGQPIKDTLCGTKALWKRDYERIAANRGYFGDFDPFGDFDLLLGAARQNLRIVDIPIRYRQRTYGSTNIHRWKHGWLLLRMALFAAFRFKFV